jgi:pilus assembly protein Flp/PilA
MFEMIRLVSAVRRDRRGVTALEYGLIAGGIALAITGAMTAIGGIIGTTFTSLANAMVNW